MSLFSSNPQEPANATAPSASWWGRTPYRRSDDAVAAGPAVRRYPWWRWNPYRREAAGDAGQTAYGEGARDANLQADDLQRRAYLNGTRDGRRMEADRHRGHPVLASVLVLIALGGAGYGYLSYQAGSFAGGGAVIDRTLADLRGDAGQAGVAGGQAVQKAGADIAAKSQTLSQPSSQPSGD